MCELIRAHTHIHTQMHTLTAFHAHKALIPSNHSYARNPRAVCFHNHQVCQQTSSNRSVKHCLCVPIVCIETTYVSGPLPSPMLVITLDHIA